MIDRNYEDVSDWIDEILEEASSFGLRNEIMESANKWLSNLSGEITNNDIIIAYQYAYSEWIK